MPAEEENVPKKHFLRLTRQSRLSGKSDFQRVFSHGTRVSARRLILWHYHRPEENAGARLGISISAKVGIAVVRNRLKRLSREAFRLNRSRLKPGSDLVVCLRPGCRWRGLPEAEHDLIDLWRKAGVLQ